MSDLRSRINEALYATAKEKVTQLVDDLFDMKKPGRGWCKQCGGKVAAEFPDYKGQAQALALLMDQGKGKPAETRKVDVTATVKKDLAEMSDDELAALAAGG